MSRVLLAFVFVCMTCVAASCERSGSSVGSAPPAPRGPAVSIERPVWEWAKMEVSNDLAPAWAALESLNDKGTLRAAAEDQAAAAIAATDSAVDRFFAESRVPLTEGTYVYPTGSVDAMFKVPQHLRRVAMNRLRSGSTDRAAKYRDVLLLFGQFQSTQLASAREYLGLNGITAYPYAAASQIDAALVYMGSKSPRLDPVDWFASEAYGRLRSDASEARNARAPDASANWFERPPLGLIELPRTSDGQWACIEVFAKSHQLGQELDKATAESVVAAARKGSGRTLRVLDSGQFTDGLAEFSPALLLAFVDELGWQGQVDLRLRDEVPHLMYTMALALRDGEATSANPRLSRAAAAACLVHAITFAPARSGEPDIDRATQATLRRHVTELLK